jgi:thioredoxin-related protein
MKLAWLSFLSLVILFCSSATSWAQSGKPGVYQQGRLFKHATLRQGWESAVENKKPLLVMFTSDNCIFCKKMLTKTYAHPTVQQLLAVKTESVVAHADDHGVLVKKLGIRGFPTSLLISPQGEVLDVMEGFVEPHEFVQRVTPLLASKTTQSGLAVRDPSAPPRSAGR